MEHLTPLRRLAADRATQADGVWLIGESDVRYIEAAELTVLEILRNATDVSADSAELDAVAGGSAVTYHLSSRRANAVRFLDLPADAKVLEVGAGCGPVTRYLAETCAVVDSVEPMARRAAIARERCRGLDNVQVFAGEVADVPAEPAYDVVLVNGVLEYIGDGSADHGPYVEFLRAVSARLLPGGVLILAIENRLGVKYVVGAPEDHTDREYDSLEGYPRRNHARVFSRRELTELLTAGGMQVGSVLAAFPDYKRTTVLLSDTIDRVDPSLAYRIPTFPSPDRRGFRHRAADELAVWRTLVEAGLTWEFPNSFVVLAHTPGQPRVLWPEGRHAVFARNVRRAEFSRRTVLQDDAGTATFRRVAHPAAGIEIDGVRLVTESMPYQPGVEALDLLARADEAEQRRILGRWRDMVREWPWDEGAPLDLVPHNLVVAPDGDLVLVDDEYRGTGWAREDVLARGALTLAMKLAQVTSAERWDQATIGDLAAHLGAMVGLEGDWIDGAVRREAGLRCTVRPPGAVDHEEVLRGSLAAPLADGPLDLQAIRRIGRMEQRMAELEAASNSTSAELDRIRRSRAYRLLGRVRRVLGRVRGVVRRARRA